MKIKVDILVFLKMLDSFKNRSCTICCNHGFTQENPTTANLSGFYGALLLPYFGCLKNIVSIVT